MPTPSSQKPDQRPIAFVLHDTAAGSTPIEVALTIRPEELTRTEPSRLVVHQLPGGDGGWVDSFGPGVGTVTLSGHTGWRGNATDDGAALFDKLHTAVYKEWHAARARALRRNQDPSLVKLIFIDSLDNFSWVVAPQQFVLRRNKARPLLMMFNITLLGLGDGMMERPGGLLNPSGLAVDAAGLVAQKSSGLASLTQSVQQLQAFSAGLQSSIGKAIGTIAGPFQSLTDVTAQTLNTVTSAVASVRDVPLAIVNGTIPLAQELAQAGANVTQSVQLITGLPQAVRGDLMRAGDAFRNAFCVLANVFSRSGVYADYSPFYGNSNCSSTWEGNASSRFTLSGTSGFEVLFPAVGTTGTLNRTQINSLRDMAAMDMVLQPRPPAWTEGKLRSFVNG
jgi:hypothetical protein